MLKSIRDPAIQSTIAQAKIVGNTRRFSIDEKQHSVAYPYPSPVDWRDCPIYFLMIDRFNNHHPNTSPNARWDSLYKFHQGGTFTGIRQQLKYIKNLGMKAIWITPVLKNAKPETWKYTYAGYGIQNFLAIDNRFGTEQELIDLVAESHYHGLYVIFDIVLNHTAHVFDYITGNGVEISPNSLIDRDTDAYDIQWLNGNGNGNPDPNWQNIIPAGTILSDDDTVYPDELRNYLYFRRRGNMPNDNLNGKKFIAGDFGDMRQMVVEYLDNNAANKYPVLDILIQCYKYLIAKYDCDGFRMDTVKFVHPDMIQTFGNAIREFALSIGKRNFFTFGEVWDNEKNIASFVGRNGSNGEGYGIDSALDFSLSSKLSAIAKCNAGVEELRNVFEARKDFEDELLTTHGEAGRYFVSFIENHDQNERFNHPNTPQDQITLGLATLFCLQGIPTIYYGTEQGLNGAKDDTNQPDLGKFESVREALWGKNNAFDQTNSLYKEIRTIAQIRENTPALRYGRLYFREVSKDGYNFGLSEGRGGIIAFSRILSDAETIIIANTNINTDTDVTFAGFVWIDKQINNSNTSYNVVYSNKDTIGSGKPKFGNYKIWNNGNSVCVDGAILYIKLAPMEIQILK